MSRTTSRFRTMGAVLAGRDAYLNCGPRMGEDWVSRRGSEFESLDANGGDEARIGDDDSGEGAAGRNCADASPSV